MARARPITKKLAWQGRFDSCYGCAVLHIQKRVASESPSVEIYSSRTAKPQRGDPLNRRGSPRWGFAYLFPRGCYRRVAPLGLLLVQAQGLAKQRAIGLGARYQHREQAGGQGI